MLEDREHWKFCQKYLIDNLHYRVFKEWLGLAVLAGELDTLTPPHLARKIANQIKGSKCVIIKKAGHLPNIEKAKEFNEAVLNFLLGLTKND